MLLRSLLVISVACGLSLAKTNWYTLVTKHIIHPPAIAFEEPDELPKAPEDLQYAFVIFRHGIRSPIYTRFQTDTEFKEMWAEGMGALTDDGKRLMFHVGESLRYRYKHLVPEYDDEVVQFTSTHSGRATMSAYSVAAGLFPVEDPIFEEEEEGLTSWQPIPVYQNTPYDKHKLFSEKVDKSHCARYTEMREQVRRAESGRTTEQREKYYSELNRRIFHTYHEKSKIYSLQDNSGVYDVYKAQMMNQKHIPSWVPNFMPMMEKMKQIRMWQFIHGKSNMVQYFTGPLFNQILKEMVDQSSTVLLKQQNMVEDDGYRVKMHFHGSHDITVCPTVWTISHDETYLALPGDTVLIEMTARAFVKVYLYVPLEKDKKKRFKELPLKPLCGTDECRLTEFMQALADIAFDEKEWKKRCSNNEQPLDNDFRPYPQDITNEDLKKIIQNTKKLLKPKPPQINP